MSRLADDTRLQDLELVCDLLGLLTLRRIGADGARLVTGIEKLIRFNRERFGAAAPTEGALSDARTPPGRCAGA